MLATLFTYYVFATLQWNFKTYPSQVSIGEEVHSTIWVRGVTDGTVGYFFNVTNPEVVLKRKEIVTEKDGYKIDYTYAVFSTTPVVVNGIGFRWIPERGKEKVYKLPSVKIFIKLVTKPGDKPKPPSDFIPVYVFNWGFVILASLLLLLIALVVAGHFYFRRSGRKKVETEQQREPPEVVAERRLEELLASPWYQKKMWKEFFLELTDIVRDYLAEVFRFSAYADTTFEILTELKIKKISSGDLAMVRTFFEKSDLIKFAKYEPTEEEVKELIESARRIIKLGLKYHEA